MWWRTGYTDNFLNIGYRKFSVILQYILIPLRAFIAYTLYSHHKTLPQQDPFAGPGAQVIQKVVTGGTGLFSAMVPMNQSPPTTALGTALMQAPQQPHQPGPIPSGIPSMPPAPFQPPQTS